MGVKEIQSKSILQKSGLPGAEYVINPYIGCVNGCVYCYAHFMKRFTNHTEPWGSFLDAKVNAPELLEKLLARRRKPLTDCVLLSSVTDPKNPESPKPFVEIGSAQRSANYVDSPLEPLLQGVETRFRYLKRYILFISHPDRSGWMDDGLG